MKNPDLLTTEQAINAINIGRTKFYQLLNDGILPAKKIGRRTYISLTDLNLFLENLQSYPIKNGGTHD